MGAAVRAAVGRHPRLAFLGGRTDVRLLSALRDDPRGAQTLPFVDGSPSLGSNELCYGGDF